ncbi:MAG: hypothetical protein H0X29_03775 [Parachlamydiaceae bacterium]|nr:hypothetical protein [Parachlamydiaceae bacterium]
MTFIEFLGFCISLVAMIFLVGKRFWDENRRRLYPEKYAEEQRKKEKLLSKFMESLDDNRKDTVKKYFDNDKDYEEDGEEDGEENANKRIDVKVQEVKPRPVLITRQKPPSLLKGSMKDSYHEGIASGKFLKGEASAYDLNRPNSAPSRASAILNSLPSPKNMLIIKEVFGPPKSMRINPWDDE